MRSCARRLRGFTLVELMVALALSGLVALMVSRLVAATTTSARALEVSRAALDREENARRWLRAALGSIDVAEEAGGFEGYPDQMRFGAWLEQPEGWWQPERVSLTIEGGAVIARVGEGEPMTLFENARALHLDYLLEPGLDSRWVGQWVSPVSAPLAVRLRIVRNGEAPHVDTLLILVGARG